MRKHTFTLTGLDFPSARVLRSSLQEAFRDSVSVSVVQGACSLHSHFTIFVREELSEIEAILRRVGGIGDYVLTIRLVGDSKRNTQPSRLLGLDVSSSYRECRECFLALSEGFLDANASLSISEVVTQLIG